MEDLYGLLDDDSSYWWSDFENNLSDSRRLLHRIESESFVAWQGIKDVEGSFSNYVESACWPLQDNVEQLYDSLRVDFVKWVVSLPPGCSRRMVMMAEDAIFLTFNYTNTLEELYRISPKKVIHLHGSVSNPSAICFGHGCDYDKVRSQLDDELFFPDTEQIDEYGAKMDPISDEMKERVASVIMDMNKDVKGVIREYRLFFESISCSYLHIYGFSFSPIDLPYIQTILRAVEPSCLKIEVSWHTKRDIDRISGFFRDYPQEIQDIVSLVRLENIGHLSLFTDHGKLISL